MCADVFVRANTILFVQRPSFKNIACLFYFIFHSTPTQAYTYGYAKLLLLFSNEFSDRSYHIFLKKIIYHCLFVCHCRVIRLLGNISLVKKNARRFGRVFLGSNAIYAYRTLKNVPAAKETYINIIDFLYFAAFDSKRFEIV